MFHLQGLHLCASMKLQSKARSALWREILFKNMHTTQVLIRLAAAAAALQWITQYQKQFS